MSGPQWAMLAALILLGSVCTEASLLSWLGLGSGAPPAEKMESTAELSGKHSAKMPTRHSAKFDVDSAAIIGLPGSSSRRRHLLEQAQAAVSSPHESCWRQAYAELAGSCRVTLANETRKCHLAVRFTNCFLAASGRPTVVCTRHMSAHDCTAGMSDHVHAVYLAFFLDAAAECHHLQAEAFKYEMEHAVNSLKENAHWLEGELGEMLDQSDAILETASQSLAAQHQLAEAQQIAHHQLAAQQEATQALLAGGLEAAERAAARTRTAMRVLSWQQKQVAAQQAARSKALAAALGGLDAKTVNLTLGMDASLAGQEKLLAGQSKAAAELARLQERQVAAFQHHRAALELLADEATAHHMAAIDWHRDMETAQDRLAAGSAAMLQAQDEFVRKQAALLSLLDRLFALQGSLLSETRALKSLLFHGASMALSFALTSAPRTSSARFPLLAVALFGFLAELGAATLLGATPADGPLALARVQGQIRKLSAALMLSLLAFCAVTYRDLAALTYQMLTEQRQDLRAVLAHVSATPGSHVTIAHAKKGIAAMRADSPQPLSVGIPRVVDEEVTDSGEDPDYLPSNDMAAADMAAQTADISKQSGGVVASAPRTEERRVYNLRPRSHRKEVMAGAVTKALDFSPYQQPPASTKCDEVVAESFRGWSIDEVSASQAETELSGCSSYCTPVKGSGSQSQSPSPSQSCSGQSANSQPNKRRLRSRVLLSTR